MEYSVVGGRRYSYCKHPRLILILVRESKRMRKKGPQSPRMRLDAKPFRTETNKSW